jgi:hypothetical protein
MTSYLAITGPETLWPDGVGFDPVAARCDDQATLDETVMLIEVPFSDVIWTEPRDLPIDRLPLLWLSPNQNNAGRWHSGGQVNGVRFNGRVFVATADDAQELSREAHVDRAP